MLSFLCIDLVDIARTNGKKRREKIGHRDLFFEVGRVRDEVRMHLGPSSSQVCQVHLAFFRNTFT